MEARRRALLHLGFFMWAPLVLVSLHTMARALALDVVGTYPAIFVFGDSLSDTGNAVLSGESSALRTAQWPYGETFPGWPTSRYSDGRLLVDLLANHLGLPPLNPYLNSSADFESGVNYAVGGATALNASFLLSLGAELVTNLSLDVQLSWHLDLRAKAESVKGKPSDTALTEGLYVIEIGGNDYIYTYLAEYTPSFVISTMIPLVMQQIRGAVETLLDSGAKHFLFITITPLGCSPLLLSRSEDGAKDGDGCLEEYNMASYLHGANLKEEVASLRLLYPSASFLLMDYYGAYDFILKHKELYGFSEILGACCGAGEGYAFNFNVLNQCNSNSVSICADPSEYVVWDGLHLTDAFNLHIFNQTLFTGTFLDSPRALE